MKPDTYRALGYKNKIERKTKVMHPLWVDDFESGWRRMESTICRQLGAVNFEVKEESW